MNSLTYLKAIWNTMFYQGMCLFSFYLTGPSHVCHGSQVCVFMGFLHVRICVVCFFFGSFSGICLFVLSHSDLFYSVLYNYYSLEYCSLRDIEKVWIWMGEEMGRILQMLWEGKMQSELILMKAIIFNKRKIKK